METFQPHVGSAFEAAAETQKIRLDLIEVRPGVENPKLVQFSLFFRGPSQPALPQRMYHLEHTTLGGLDLFLVPVASEPEGLVYQAVFNRFAATPARKP